MKSLLIVSVTVGLFLASCQTPAVQECPKPPLVPKFLSQTHFKGKYSDDHALTYFNQLNESIIQKAIEKALDGSLEVYSPLSPPWDTDDLFKLEKNDVERQFNSVDTMYIEAPDPPYDLVMIVNDKGESEKDKVVALRAYESWEVDDSLRIRKNVLAYTLVSENLDPTTGEVRGWEPKFTVLCTDVEPSKKKVATVRYTQEIDNNESEDDWYRFRLEHSVRERLFSDLLESAQHNSLAFYAEPSGETQLAADEIRRRIMYVDTMYIEAPEPPYDLQMTVVEEAPYWGNISAIEFVQDVYVDDNLNVSYDVKWYAPKAKVRDRLTGKILGEETLFWVKCS